MYRTQYEMKLKWNYYYYYYYYSFFKPRGSTVLYASETQNRTPLQSEYKSAYIQKIICSTNCTQRQKNL